MDRVRIGKVRRDDGVDSFEVHGKEDWIPLIMDFVAFEESSEVRLGSD